MQVILLERVGRLGTIGDEVKVRNGFARNYLLPQGKALRATEANRAKFEGQRSTIEARNAEAREAAAALAGGIDGKSVVIIRQAGENGQLYGSVASRDIAEALSTDGTAVTRSQVDLNRPIKSVGLHQVTIRLHAEVASKVTVNVARSDDEARRQAAGEDLTHAAFGAEEGAPALTEVFEAGVAEALAAKAAADAASEVAAEPEAAPARPRKRKKKPESDAAENA
ncbi:MAG: 50S ribosomal protein L9 [Cucumibacter sp.]